MTLTPEDLTAAKVLQLPVGGAVGYLCYAPHDPAMRRKHGLFFIALDQHQHARPQLPAEVDLWVTYGVGITDASSPFRFAVTMDQNDIRMDDAGQIAG